MELSRPHFDKEAQALADAAEIKVRKERLAKRKAQRAATLEMENRLHRVPKRRLIKHTFR